MSGPLAIAFKEWAVICRALAVGRQSLILRKGGIAETGGQFRPEHVRFLLLPTYFHEQHRTGIKPDLMPLLDAAEAEKPTEGTIHFTHFVEVASVHFATDLDQVLALDALHGWSPETVRQRFHYRAPGLYVLLVRTYRLREDVQQRDWPGYAGCKTWVFLDEPVEAGDAETVMAESAFADYREAVKSALS